MKCVKCSKTLEDTAEMVILHSQWHEERRAQALTRLVGVSKTILNDWNRTITGPATIRQKLREAVMDVEEA